MESSQASATASDDNEKGVRSRKQVRVEVIWLVSETNVNMSCSPQPLQRIRGRGAEPPRKIPTTVRKEVAAQRNMRSKGAWKALRLWRRQVMTMRKVCDLENR